MAIKKRLFRNKPSFNDFGIYTYDGDGVEYTDSDSVPIAYDKFIDKDLYTNSVGNPLNEAVVDSKMINSTNSAVDDLKFLGDTSVQINNLMIKNRGVTSRINDVFFRLFIFSSAYYNPIEEETGEYKSYYDIVGFSSVYYNPIGETGEYKSYYEIVEDLQGDYNDSWFYSQNGPNYSEGGEPGDFPGVSGLKIIKGFDMTNAGPNDETGGNGTIASFDVWDNQYSTFNPAKSLLKTGATVTGAAGDTLNLSFSENEQYDDLTTIFQEDGAYNPIYIAIHMDGDQNPRHSGDRSRNNTLSLYQFDPRELFNFSGTNLTGIKNNN